MEIHGNGDNKVSMAREGFMKLGRPVGKGWNDMDDAEKLYDACEKLDEEGWVDEANFVFQLFDNARNAARRMKNAEEIVSALRAILFLHETVKA